MFAALTVATVVTLVAACAMHTPKDAAGNPVPRSQRTPWGNARSLLGF